jgi:hypothetical protein
MLHQMLARRFAKAYSRRAIAAGAAALLVLAWAFSMHYALVAWPAPYWFEHRFAQTVDSPFLALEFARNQSEIETVLQVHDSANPDPEKSSKAQRSLRFRALLDCVYVPLCAGYLALFALCYAPGRRARIALFLALGLCIAVAWLENRVLLNSSQPVALLAHGKWLLWAAAMVLIGFIVIGRKPGPYSTATRRLVFLLHIAAGALIATGLLFGQLPWISTANSLFLAGVACNLIGLASALFTLKGRRQVPDPDFCHKRRAGALQTRQPLTR